MVRVELYIRDISGHVEVLAALHGQVRLVPPHFLQNERVLDIVGHRVGQYIMVLAAVPPQTRFLTTLRPAAAHSASSRQHVQVLPVIVDLLPMLFSLVPLQLSRSFAVSL